MITRPHDYLYKLNSILHRNRVNFLPKCGFLNFFFVPFLYKLKTNCSAQVTKIANWLSVCT